MLKLQGDDGYYSRSVEVAGTRFDIRELSAEELKRFGEVSAAADDTSVEMAGGAESGSDVIRSVISAIGQSWGVVEYVVRTGVVAWGLAGHECTPENVSRLPNAVKKALYREVMADSVLTTEELDFLTKRQ